MAQQDMTAVATTWWRCDVSGWREHGAGAHVCAGDDARMAMRARLPLIGVGLALVKWPLLPEANALPLYEGVTLRLTP